MNLQSRQSLVRILNFRVVLLSSITTLGTFAALVLIVLLAINLANQQIHDQATAAAYSLDRFFVGLSTRIETVAETINQSETSGQVLRVLMDAEDTVFSVQYADLDGRIIAERRRVGRSTSTNVELASILPELERQSQHWSEVSTEAFGVPFIQLYTGVPDATQAGALSGVLIAQIDLTALWSLITSIDIDQVGYGYLVDTDGQLLAYRDISQLRTSANLGDLLGISVDELRGDSGLVPQFHAGLSGGMVVWQSQPLETQSWLLVVEKPLDAVLSPLIGLFLIPLALLVVVVGIVINTVQFVRRRITDPLNAIREGILRFRATEPSENILALHETDDEIGLLAQTFNVMSLQINGLLNTLEQRVSRRTRDLTLASYVSRRITTELNLQNLLEVVTQLTTQAFDLYHTWVLLYDETTHQLKSVQGAGSAAQPINIDTDITIDVNAPGIIAEAARTKNFQLANDVALDQRYVAHPLLPETRSELAIPIMYRDQLVGVFDLQAKTLQRFRDEDVAIMATLGDQIAIAIENARLFSKFEAALRRAERSDSAKSTFLASMSHELRTPLNAIINFTRFVVKGSMGSVNSQQTAMLNDVISSAKHLLNLINDVLDMSKIDSGSLTLFITEDVSLAEIADQALSVARSLLIDKPVELRHEIAPDLPLLRADKQRILQIMLNVMSNACKFTEKGYVQLSISQTADEVLIAVSDTGSGIAEEDQAAVFEPFRQTETGLRQGGGTGLGMPITKNLVELHGGRIWINSVVEQGSTFYIALPIKSEKLIVTLTA